MATHTFTFSHTSGFGTIARSVLVTDSASLEISETIAADVFPRIICPLDVSQLKGLFILMTAAPLPALQIPEGVGIDLKTNSFTAPANTITVIKDIPFVWIYGGDALRDTVGAPLITDITALFGETTDYPVQIEVRAIYDATV